MLTGLHLLLTYRCTLECEHCFLFGSPRARGTFSLDQIRTVLTEAKRIGTVDTIYFEGGEPFLYHALLVQGVVEATRLGFKTGIVTNAYWAETVPDATLSLSPLIEAGLTEMAVSEDGFHSAPSDQRLAANAIAAAEQAGLPVFGISIPHPGESDGVMFRGRAAECLTTGLPAVPPEGLTECPHEDLVSPERVHLDSLGNVHLCQGLLIGNFLETPLSEIIREYRVANHPICGPINDGGPFGLAEHFRESPEVPPVSACHLCYQVRKKLRETHPECLGPAGVYGESF